ncbi:hypothetical protein [Dolichospermum sp. UHCC 0260]|nr:hypothetical protein [Dolichospermum sp. UHCC 0260]
MKEAEIPYKTEEFMTVGNTTAFNLFVDLENLKIARELCMQVELYRQY